MKKLIVPSIIFVCLILTVITVFKYKYTSLEFPFEITPMEKKQFPKNNDIPDDFKLKIGTLSYPGTKYNSVKNNSQISIDFIRYDSFNPDSLFASLSKYNGLFDFN